MRKLGRVWITLTLSVGAAFAQATDGNVTFEYTSFNPVRANFEVDNGTDHMFLHWWYFRILGQTWETPLPSPDSEVYDGNIATLRWTDINGWGWSVTEVTTITDTGDQEGTLRHELTITNNNQAPLTMSVFHYTDLDVDGNLDGDSAADATATSLVVIDDSLAYHRGLGADAFKVAEFSALLDDLDNLAFTALDNSGTPFGPGDFTGAFEWKPLIIPSDRSATWSVVHTVNNTTSPPELTLSGECPGASELRIEGITPFAAVTVVGANSVGSFAIPAGVCSGTRLNLDSDSAEVIGRLSVDGSGRITLPIDLPNALCGRIAQAVDNATCSVTNIDLIQ